MAYGRSLLISFDDGTTIDTAATDAALRAAFAIKRDKSRDPDAAEVVIYNLSKSTRFVLDMSERQLCRIEAGYKDQGRGQIFFGYLNDVAHARQGADWLTRISLADDGKKRVRLARINRTFPKNMLISVVLRQLVKATGIPEGNLAQFASRARLGDVPLMPRAWHANGVAIEELNAFCRSMGFELSIKDGAFQFSGIGSPTAPAGGALVSKLTGMIESPSLDDKGNVSVTSLMLPDLRPGQVFAVEAELQGSGIYLCTSTEHKGDTHDQEWYTQIEGSPFNAGLLASGLKVIN